MTFDKLQPLLLSAVIFKSIYILNLIPLSIMACKLTSKLLNLKFQRPFNFNLFHLKTFSFFPSSMEILFLPSKKISFINSYSISIIHQHDFLVNPSTLTHMHVLFKFLIFLFFFSLDIFEPIYQWNRRKSFSFESYHEKEAKKAFSCKYDDSTFFLLKNFL